jgi:hypothetical protein
MIAIRDAIFRSRRLMLVPIILERFGKAHRAKTGSVKRLVIATASEAIQRKDQANRLSPIDLFDGARQFARRRVGVIYVTGTGKKPDAVRRARRGISADNVVVEHAAYGVALLLHPRQHVFGSEQALLFS